MGRKHSRKAERLAEKREVRSGELGTVGALLLMVTLSGEAPWLTSQLLPLPNPMALHFHEGAEKRLLEPSRPAQPSPALPQRSPANQRLKADRR